MKFNLFGLFRQKNAPEDVAESSSASNQEKTGKQWPPPMMPQEQWDKYWPELEATEQRKKRRFRIGTALYEAYPEMDRNDRHDLEREIARLVINDEAATQAIIARIKEKQQCPEQILEELKKNMSVGNVVGGNSPAP